MTEIKKSSDSYGGSLGLQTTVNMGLRLLKPRIVTLVKSGKLKPFMISERTANRKFWTAGDEL